jgi:hypothetical protein
VAADGTVTITAEPEQVKSIFRQFWENLEKRILTTPIRTNVGDHTNHMRLMDPLTWPEFQRGIKELPTKKAVGPDGITGEMVKWAGPKIQRELYEILNRILYTGKVPTAWKHGHLYPLIKTEGGDPTDPPGRRPIMLISILQKLLNRMLAKRLQEWVGKEKLIGHEQYAFQAGRSIETPLSRMFAVIKDAKMRKKPLYILGLDVAKAYDNVDFSALQQGLEQANIDQRFIEYVGDLYQGRTASVLTGYGPTEPYAISRGISQGDPLSCLLFVLYMEDGIRRVRSMQCGYTTERGKRLKFLPLQTMWS